MKRAGWWVVLAGVLVAGVGLAGCESGKPFQVEVRLIDDQNGRPVTQGVVTAEWWDSGKIYNFRTGTLNFKGGPMRVGLAYSGELDSRGVARFEASDYRGSDLASLRFSLRHHTEAWSWGRQIAASKVSEIARRGETLVVPGLVWRSREWKMVRVQLPTGFTGLVRLVAPAQVSDGPPAPGWAEGQWRFTVAASADGTAEMPSHPTLSVQNPAFPDRRVFETEYFFESPGGGEVLLQYAWPTDQTVEGVRAWRWPSGGSADVVEAWFIGTQEQYRAAYPPDADGRWANPR